MLPKDYDKLLFNKLAYEFSVMSAGMIKTDLELVDKKDYFYFSYKTKVWIYHAETKWILFIILELMRNLMK